MRVAPKILAGIGLWLAAGISAPFAQTAQPDKSSYTLFNPVPVDQMRDFNTDRPPKANVPYTVDAGHFQYETDIVNFAFDQLAGSVHTDTFLVPNPTFKFGLTNNIEISRSMLRGASVSTASMPQPERRARCGASTTSSCAPRSISGAMTAARLRSR
jgi:hypothetical protein